VSEWGSVTSGRLALGFRAIVAALTLAAFTAVAAALLGSLVSAQPASGSVTPFGDAISPHPICPGRPKCRGCAHPVAKAS
jgi:hypothetical protein